MWTIFFSLSLCGTIISAITSESVFWFALFNIAMYICVAGVVFTREKQKEKIKSFEERLKKLEEDKNV